MTNPTPAPLSPKSEARIRAAAQAGAGTLHSTLGANVLDSEVLDLLAELDRVRAERDRLQFLFQSARDRADNLSAERNELRDKETLKAAPRNSDDWDDDTWAAWWRHCERVHGPATADTPKAGDR